MSDVKALVPLKNTSSSTSNKDLSCLRCRKKKAKCSKTRPACTRCARSNQPCEYPDAPPNLADLSQKVLGLYDTLRELEGQFLLQYTQSIDTIQAHSAITDNEEEIKSQSTSPASPIPGGTKIISQQQQQQLQCAHSQGPSAHASPPSITINAPLAGSWSMSFTQSGLSLNAIIKNASEFISFIKDFSQQIQYGNRDNNLNVIVWDDDEAPLDEDDDDQLDEDEYLVTVAVHSIASLVGDAMDTKKMDCTNIPGGTLFETLHACRQNLFSHLSATFKMLDSRTYPIHLFHSALLMPFLRRCDLLSKEPDIVATSFNRTDKLSLLCFCTAYAVSTSFLEPPTSIPTNLASDCASYGIGMLLDLVLDGHASFTITACALLLARIAKMQSLIYVGARSFGGIAWDVNDRDWQILSSCILYLDVYMYTFSSSCLQNSLGDAVPCMLRSTKGLLGSANDSEERCAVALALETQLSCLLNRALGLFYHHDVRTEAVRRVDVDHVLTLVKDIEEWEHRLPSWARWDSKETQSSSLKMHIHMIHNILKIFLFRPFCTVDHPQLPEEEDNNPQQTHTRTTFLDMSIAAADRLATCITELHKSQSDKDSWTKAAGMLIQDVFVRVQHSFNCDEEVMHDIRRIQERLVTT